MRSSQSPLGIGALVFALLVSACTTAAPPPSSAAPAGGVGTTARVRVTGDWNSYDPYVLLNQSAAQIAPAVYDYLLTRPASDRRGYVRI